MRLLKQDKTFSLRRNSAKGAKIGLATFTPLHPQVLQIIGMQNLPCGGGSKRRAIQLPQGALLWENWCRGNNGILKIDSAL